MSKRNFATLLLNTTQSSNQLRHVPTVSPTCSHGNIITVGAERFRCESIFQAIVIGKEASGMRDFFFPEHHDV